MWETVCDVYVCDRSNSTIITTNPKFLNNADGGGLAAKIFPVGRQVR